MLKKIIGTIKNGSISAIASTVSQINELKTEVTERINQCDEITDDLFYAVAEEEVDQGKYDRGLWSKALIIANGDESRRKTEYMKLRVNQLQQYQLAAIKDQREYVAKAITIESTPAITHKNNWTDHSMQSCIKYLNTSGYANAFEGKTLIIIHPFGAKSLIHNNDELHQFMEREFGPYK